MLCFQYVRLADNTPMEDVVELMLSNWHMNSPVPASLVITVIGGAKNFKLDGKKREVFNRGLVNVSFGKTCRICCLIHLKNLSFLNYH